MNFGINTFLFSSPFSNSGTPLFEQFKQWGFDSVEIAVEEPAKLDAELIKKELKRNQLKCGSLCGVLTPDRDLRGNTDQQKNALDYLKASIDLMVQLECPVLIGPLYSSVGRAEAVEEEEYKLQWEMVVGHLQRLSTYALERGKKLALEPLNRFETDFINTCEQGLKMIKDVGSPALALMLDTFHMNIEEKDIAGAILKAGRHLVHFHACANDRGTPGNDHLDWKKITGALQQIQYKGDIVIESFTKEVKSIARAAAIWRKIEASSESIAIEGLKFLKKEFAT